MEIVAAGVALLNRFRHAALGVIAGKLNAVGKQQGLHGVRQQVHEIFLAAGAGDILVIFLGGGAQKDRWHKTKPPCLHFLLLFIWQSARECATMN